MSIIIEFNHFCKQYRLGLVSTKTLSRDLDHWGQTAVLHKEDPYLKIGSVNDCSKIIIVSMGAILAFLAGIKLISK